MHDRRKHHLAGAEQCGGRPAGGQEPLLANGPVGVRVRTGQVDHAGTSAFIRSAFWPENSSNRRTITSQKCGSSSIRNAWRPVCSAAMSVVPEPPNGSSTRSPSRELLVIARMTSSTGFMVGCSSDRLGRGISHTSSRSRAAPNEDLPIDCQPYQMGSYRRWYFERPSTNTSLTQMTVADQ